jgi:hypothetical protein
MMSNKRIRLCDTNETAFLAAGRGRNVIVYREQQEDVELAAALQRLERALMDLFEGASPDVDMVTEQAIEAGELASGVLDLLYAQADDIHAGAQPWNALVCALAAAADAAWRGHARECRESLATALTAIGSCTQSFLPRRITRRVSEGFAYYALGPELYADAAREWDGVRPGDRVICVGLRTIGLTLAASAIAGLSSRGVHASLLTVRPRGNPFDRTVAVTPRFKRMVQAWRDAMFLVVDEGPGLSGSSMASVATMLSRLGVDDDRIVLMPAYRPDVSAMSNREAGERWGRHPIVIPDFDRVWIRSGRLARAFDAVDVPVEVVDVAAGRWRTRSRTGALAPVHPHHERRKFAVRTAGRREWIKFAGLGRYGRLARERAEQAAAAGWGPPVHGFKHGWIAMPELDGSALIAGNGVDPLRLADYLGFIKRTWGTGTGSSPDRLLEVGEHNVRVLCNERAAERFARLRPSASAEAVRVDGRHFPHEWVGDDPAKSIKTDGVDHHDDHFFPGPVDIAWDVSGVIEEWRMDSAAERAFLESYRRTTGDNGIAVRLPFYRAAYLAFRGAYALMAAGQLSDTPDGDRFRAAARRYRSRLQQLLHG